MLLSRRGDDSQRGSLRARPTMQAAPARAANGAPQRAEEKTPDDDAACAPPPCKQIKLDVTGTRFQTLSSVLSHVESAMLGRMFGRCAAKLPPEDGSSLGGGGARFRLLLDLCGALRDLENAPQRALAADEVVAAPGRRPAREYGGPGRLE
ncbi:hypothetical protein M885DRAFT_556245 [Pelagophyceae sp. CCMP2097]|nr:hypothetical protein M885DRAFT_556245 [Pelagophyceae sp. CCMP2097]